MIPDIVILEIFDFYDDKESIGDWHTLVHVCRRWRNIIFGAPRRLNLRLFCGCRTRVREMLAVWPPLPIVIRDFDLNVFEMDSETRNLNVALEHTDRICEMDFTTILESEKVLAAIQQPLPLLTHLKLEFED
jgi:hypothetical protein